MEYVKPSEVAKYRVPRCQLRVKPGKRQCALIAGHEDGCSLVAPKGYGVPNRLNLLKLPVRP